MYAHQTVVHDALADRVASVKHLLHSATSGGRAPSHRSLSDSASLQAFKTLLAEAIAARQSRISVPPATIAGTVELLDESTREEHLSPGAGVGAALPEVPKQQGAPLLPTPCPAILQEHLARVGVSAEERWTPLHVQAVCWGVPMWVLHSAQGSLHTDGLPPSTDALHWVIRLWPVLSKLQAAGSCSGASVFGALLQQQPPQPPAPLAQLWAARKDGVDAVLNQLKNGYGTTVLPLDAFAQLVCAVPEGVQCPDVPAPWLSGTAHAQRQEAWGWLQSHFDMASANAPPYLVSAQGSSLQAPPLGAQEALLLAALWHPALPEHALIATARKNPVRKSDLQRLKPSSWLNDELINCRLSMFAEAAEASPARSYVPNLYFLNSLGTGDEYNYNAVRRWTKRAKVDVVQLDRAVFPINTANMHWTAAVVDFHTQECVHWDSLSGGVAGQHGDELRSLRHWLADEVQDKHALQLGEQIGLWPLKAAPAAAVPQQTNGIDCGVFCVQFCVGLLCGAEAMLAKSCRSEHVAYLRLWFALAFLACGPDKTEVRPGQWDKYLRDTRPAAKQPPCRQAAIFSSAGGAASSVGSAAAGAAGTDLATGAADECLVLSD